MAAFSLGKLLFLGFILLVLWYGVKFFARVGEVRQAVRRAARQAAEMQGQTQREYQGSRAIPTEDLVKCRTCGAFVPAKSATSCGRGDCPWHG